MAKAFLRKMNKGKDIFFQIIIRPKQNIVLFPASLAKKNWERRSEKDFIFNFIFGRHIV